MQDSSLLAAVGERLISLRTVGGLALEEAARGAGIDIERLAEAEAGEAALCEAELQRLAARYGVEITAFFGGRVTPLSYLAGA